MWKSIHDFCNERQLAKLAIIKETMSGFMDEVTVTKLTTPGAEPFSPSETVVFALSEIIGSLVGPYPNLAYVISQIENLGSMLTDTRTTSWFEHKKHYSPPVKKQYRKFSIEWFGDSGQDPLIQDIHFQRDVVTAIESMLSKLPRYAQFMKNETRSGTLVSLEIRPPGPQFPLLVLDFWYDERADLFGMWITQGPEVMLGRVEFPEDIWL